MNKPNKADCTHWNWDYAAMMCSLCGITNHELYGKPANQQSALPPHPVPAGECGPEFLRPGEGVLKEKEVLEETPTSPGGAPGAEEVPARGATKEKEVCDHSARNLATCWMCGEVMPDSMQLMRKLEHAERLLWSAHARISMASQWGDGPTVETYRKWFREFEAYRHPAQELSAEEPGKGAGSGSGKSNP